MWDPFDFDRDGITNLFEKVVGIELLESSSQDGNTIIDDSESDIDYLDGDDSDEDDENFDDEDDDLEDED